MFTHAHTHGISLLFNSLIILAFHSGLPYCWPAIKRYSNRIKYIFEVSLNYIVSIS